MIIVKECPKCSFDLTNENRCPKCGCGVFKRYSMPGQLVRTIETEPVSLSQTDPFSLSNRINFLKW